MGIGRTPEIPSHELQQVTISWKMKIKKKKKRLWGRREGEYNNNNREHASKENEERANSIERRGTNMVLVVAKEGWNDKGIAYGTTKEILQEKRRGKGGGELINITMYAPTRVLIN